METGEVIKKLRNEKKFTQSELGIMLGVNTSSIQKYESGATKNLKLETIKEHLKIALGVNEEGMKKIFDYVDDIQSMSKYRNSR